MNTYLAYINDDRIIASQMIMPIFISNLFIWSTISILYFNIRLTFNTIQIFVKTIQQKSKKFLLRRMDIVDNVREHETPTF